MYVSNFVKKTPNYCRHISNCHVICARLHTTCNDPTEMFQLNERPVTRLLYSDAARVTWNNWTSYRQIWRRLRGNWAREVKPLMRQGKHSSDVCLAPAAQRSGNFWPTLYYHPVHVSRHPIQHV